LKASNQPINQASNQHKLRLMKSCISGTIYLCVVFPILLSSCIPNKKVVYFQDDENSLPNDSLVIPQYHDYRLLEGDIIDIKVKSKDPVLSELFLMHQASSNMQQMMQCAQNGSDIFYLTGYTINSNGDIELPVVGEIHVEGYTLEELKPIVKERIAKYIKEPYVEVKLGGVRFTALGEFNKPGRYGILQSDVTIFEAIANAGDLTILADRKHDTLIRQYPDGERVHEIDLTQRDIMNSEFYFIQPNDLLYLQPLKVRELGTGVTGAQTFSTVVATITGLVVIISLFTN